MGKDRFAETAGVSLEEAQESVSIYRTRLPKVPQLWDTYQRALRYCHQQQKELSVRLPSGRTLNYGVPTAAWKDGRMEYMVAIQKHGNKQSPVRLHGPKCCENASQASSRDIFCALMLNLEAAGHEILLHVHDEVLLCVDADKAEDTLREVVRIMSTAPDWIPDIPLSAEGCISTVYTKG